MQRLVHAGLVLSGHDVSAGGLVSTLVEMAMAGDAGAAVDLTHVDQDGTHARTKTQLWGGVEESIADCSPVGLVVVVVCGQPGLRCSRRSWGWCWRCGPGRRPGCETWYSSTHRPRGSSASVGPPSTHMTTERRGRKLAGCGWMAGQRAAAVTVLLMGVCGGSRGVAGAGRSTASRRFRVEHGGKVLVDEQDVGELRAQWEATSLRMEREQTDPACVQAEAR